MLRVIVFLVLVGLIAAGAAWLADQPGDVAITWHGLQIETSVAVAAVAILAVIAVAILLWSIARALWRSPDFISMLLRDRRGIRGYQAISRGLVAIGAGDADAARKYARAANRIAPGDALVLLLSAQTAQLAGDPDAAERAFRAMTTRPETKLLGLRGLFIEAQRRSDFAAARAYAEEAAKTAPALGWAGQAVLELRCVAHDWEGALTALESNAKHGLLKPANYRRQRAVLITARAQAIAESDRDQARTLALEAVKLAPTLVPAAALAGRRLAESGELRKASRILERAWRANPHPDLAETYANLRFGDSARDRLARVETLAQRAPGHIESALALAQAALDALEFEKARAALRPMLGEPTRRVALMMARIEQREHGDLGRAREWIARAVHAARDPGWTADGIVSETWLPVSPATGRLDAFEWRVPLAELAHAGPVLEERSLMASMVEAAPTPPVELEPEPEPQPEPEAQPSVSEPAATAAQPAPAAPTEEESVEPAPKPKAPRARRKTAAPTSDRTPEPIIPLVHAPDDPGPATETEEPHELPHALGWLSRPVAR